MDKLWFLYILAEVLIQGYLIEKKAWKPIYIQLFIIRGIASIIHGVIMDVQYTPWYEYPNLLLFQVTSFWIFFDLGLNLYRKRPLLYKGKDSGWLDDLPNWVYWPLKVISFIVLLIKFT